VLAALSPTEPKSPHRRRTPFSREGRADTPAEMPLLRICANRAQEPAISAEFRCLEAQRSALQRWQAAHTILFGSFCAGPSKERHHRGPTRSDTAVARILVSGASRGGVGRVDARLKHPFDRGERLQPEFQSAVIALDARDFPPRHSEMGRY